jgi:YVTN family beta-propeller protein
MFKVQCSKVAGALLLLGVVAGLLSSCRTDDPIIYSTTYDTGGGTQPSGDITGMYVLCEGNMGSNKCTLDFLDLTTAQYHRNIYSELNPETVKELGDVGNDIKVYGSRLWMIINCSNKVEVADVGTARRIGQVDIPNCRYLAFHDGYAYVSSFAGPVMGAEEQLGLVYKVDTLTLEIAGRVEVGYQPEEMAVLDGKLYVVNSGGYMPPVYDNRVSVIDLNTFKVERTIEVGRNLHRCRADRYGQLWITSRGNYEDVPPRVYCMQQSSDGYVAIGDEIDASISEMCLVGDSLYYIGTAWSEILQRNTVSYGIINVRTHQKAADHLSTAPEMSKIRLPYGIIVNPINRDFYIMDAKNYVSSGELLHFLPDGTFDWSVRTGDIPAHAVFISSKRLPY